MGNIAVSELNDFYATRLRLAADTLDSAMHLCQESGVPYLPLNHKQADRALAFILGVFVKEVERKSQQAAARLLRFREKASDHGGPPLDEPIDYLAPVRAARGPSKSDSRPKKRPAKKRRK